MFLCISYTISKCCHLFAVCDLLQVSQVDHIPVDHHRFFPHRLHLDPVISAKCFIRSWHSVISRFLCRLLRHADLRKVLCFFFRQYRNVFRNITIHLDNTVCNMEISSRTSCNNHCRDPIIFIQFPDSFNKWCDRLHLPVDHALHQLITNHKVRCTRIFIDQEQGCSCLNSFDHICCLRGTSTCIFCTE